MRRIVLFVAALAGLFASPAFAQSTYPTPAGSRVNGTVPLVCDTSGANCVPSGSTGSGSGTATDPATVQGRAANGAAVAGNPNLIAGSDGSSVRTIATDSAGRQLVVLYSDATSNSGIAPGACTSVAASCVGKSSSGTLYGWNVTAGASAGYVMIFNAISAPADGAVTPLRCIPLAANAGIEVNYRPNPLLFSTGITLVFSTTGCFTKTASATAFFSADAR